MLQRFRENWVRPALFFGNNPISLAGGAITTASGVTMIAYWLVELFGRFNDNPYLGIIFFLLLPAVFGPQGTGGIRRFLQWWPMASLGMISYGIYLWHETWIYRILGAGGFSDFTLEFWAFFFAVLGLTIITASLSYFVVEKPALRLKNSIAWWRRPARRPATEAPPTP